MRISCGEAGASFAAAGLGGGFGAGGLGARRGTRAAGGGSPGGDLRLFLFHFIGDKAVDLVELEELLGCLPDRSGEMLVLTVQVAEGFGRFVVFLGIGERFKDDGFQCAHNVECDMMACDCTSLKNVIESGQQLGIYRRIGFEDSYLL